MDDRISFTEMDYISKYLHSEYDVDTTSTLQHVYESYTVMPSSKLNRLSSIIHNNHMNYLGTFSHKTSVYDLYASESTYSLIKITPEKLISGDIKPVDIDKDKLYNALGVVPKVAVEDITETTMNYLLYEDATPYNIVLEADALGDVSVSDPAGGVGGGNDSGGGGVEDITATTDDVLKDSGLDGGANDTANDMSGDDLGGMDDDLDGEDGEGENSPDMMDEDADDDEPDDEGTAAKKRIRKNMYKLHTIIRDNLDAMKSFTPAYEIENSRKYYRVQSILNTADEITLRIIRDQINNMTVEDLMKKYTTLCQILDLATRYMHEFKSEYNAIADKYQRKSKKTTEVEGKTGDEQLQQ